ncbi:Alpha-methylacyl-CoA racemase [Holothuria leucospilota]|uniref:Alpha-methylacyl-CoA racemase n=1 Tax=Holothuria leucospilota TaxID=206669 RepID=A0A9Q1BMI7_HOLLE|nr:Alpha-methylacyl-CoA racemase [Holothuria leucospilota]
MALKGVKVIELAGLAPAPFAGMVLADFGAQVIRVDRATQLYSMDRLARGKQSIALNWKKPEGLNVLRKLCVSADVVIEPFRPGVMEKMGLGPQILLKENPRLIYARMTGFGQSGCYKNMAGHDINYIATSGVLAQLGRKGEKPLAPINLLGDFAGGGMVCALGICMALYERAMSGKGQVIDANMVEGSAYISAFTFMTKGIGLVGGERGTNMLDSGAFFYDTYKTLDGKYMAVGALEPQFYAELLKGLGLNPEELPDQLNREEWPAMKKMVETIFASKTREEWTKIFNGKDACVTPVLTPDEAPHHPHNKENKAFLANDDGDLEPVPAPRLSRTPASPRTMAQPSVGQDTETILSELGYSREEMQQLAQAGAVGGVTSQSKL